MLGNACGWTKYWEQLFLMFRKITFLSKRQYFPSSIQGVSKMRHGSTAQRHGVSRGSATDKRLQWFIISRCPSRSHLITRDLEAQRKMINHWSLLLVALPWRSRNHTWLSLRSNKNTCWAATYLLSSAIIYSVVWLMQVISCVASQSSYKLKICLLVFELSAFCCISILCLQDYSV